MSEKKRRQRQEGRRSVNDEKRRAEVVMMMVILIMMIMMIMMGKGHNTSMHQHDHNVDVYLRQPQYHTTPHHTTQWVCL